MNLELKISQISCMKHAIGFSRDKATGRKFPKYKAYLNYFATSEGCEYFDDLVDLVEKGLMISRQDGSQGWLFHLSKEGFEVLSDITEVDMQEDDNE